MRWLNIAKVAVLIVVLAIVSALVLSLFSERVGGSTPQPVAVSSTSTTAATAPPRLLLPWPKSGALRAVFTGEDLTHGLYASAPALDYASLTTAFIGQTGAVQSTTIGQASSTLSDLLGQPAPDGAGLIVVEFGTKEAYAGALPMFTSNYSTYLDELTTASPKAAIVCLGTWTYSTLGGAFDAAIKTACTQHDGIYIKLADLYTAVGNPYRATLGSSWSGGKVPDAVHANDAGNRSVSDRIVAALLTS